MINTDVNVKSRLEEEYVIKDLFGIQTIVNVNKCEKSCDVGQNLNYENCKCKNRRRT